MQKGAPLECNVHGQHFKNGKLLKGKFVKTI